MSLIGFAVRICTTQALLGQTLAGNAIEDSPIDPVAVAMQLSSPYIAVFTDTENNKPDTRSMIEGHHHQDLAFHIFLPTELQLTVNGTAYDFKGRESGAALVIDIIYRQIEQVLMSGQSVWANLWRSFVTKIIEIDRRAYVLQTTDTGIRVPAREIVMRCDTLFSPPLGAAPAGPWADLIAALEADAETEGLGPLLAGAITGASLPLWRREEAELGLADGDMAAMGLGPLTGFDAHGGPAEDQTEDVVPAIQVTVDGRDAPDPLVITPPPS